MDMASRQEHEKPVLQLVGDLLADVRILVRQEVALARAEIREELSHLLVIVALGGVALGMLAVAGLWILIAATRAIATIFQWPLSAVYAAVGAALAIVGLVLLAIAWRQVYKLRVLPKTRETLKASTQWATRHVSEVV